MTSLDHFRKKYSNKCNFNLPKQVIHGDFNSNNIFVNFKSNKITNIIDWEQASCQFRIYEVVYAANFFSLNKYSHKEPYDLKKFFNFISAYNNINPLTKKEKNYASVVLLLHWLNSTWIIEDFLFFNRKLKTDLLNENIKIIRWLDGNIKVIKELFLNL